MNKAALVKKIVAHLTGKMSLHVGAARSAHAEATHEQSRADDKYDTRGLEASYLARGQAMQFAETEQALAQFHTMTVRKFPPDDPADLGALVEVESGDERTIYFIGPGAGGTEIVHEKKTGSMRIEPYAMCVALKHTGTSRFSHSDFFGVIAP